MDGKPGRSGPGGTVAAGAAPGAGSAVDAARRPGVSGCVVPEARVADVGAEPWGSDRRTGAVDEAPEADVGRGAVGCDAGRVGRAESVGAGVAGVDRWTGRPAVVPSEPAGAVR